MATISRRIQDLETKTTRAAGTVLTVIRKILRPNTPEGGTWVAKFDAQHSPSKLAGKDFLSEPGESEETFRARIKDMADTNRKKGQPVRFFISSLDAQL